MFKYDSTVIENYHYLKTPTTWNDSETKLCLNTIKVCYLKSTYKMYTWKCFVISMLIELHLEKTQIFRLEQFHMKNISLCRGLGYAWPSKGKRKKSWRPVLTERFWFSLFLFVKCVSFWGVCGTHPCCLLWTSTGIHIRIISKTLTGGAYSMLRTR